ncbi:ribosomal-processing cysteine protease Prp [Moorella sp. ACPs]|uniref:ribosomal-processing cysteine protease Prp n=1 Tax=Neomoorella carbonis TaxID=3062783 RepID=UPI003244EB11
MIRIVFWQERGGSLTGFTVSGHSGYRPKGEDIVCAAVSALAQTAVLSLKDHLEEEPRVSIREGFLECRLPACLSPAGQEKARVILKTIETGLNAIATDYGDYVRLEYRRV